MTNEFATANESSAPADARHWARHTLGLDEQTEPLDSAAMLRLVVKADYALTPEGIDAVQILANPLNLAARPELLKHGAALGKHQRHDEAVTAFIQQFFDLTCDERLRRWKSLVDKCANEPALATRLNRVEPGLDVELPPFTDNMNNNHLVQTCRDVFLSRPAKAARLRREFCEMWRHAVSTWEDVTDQALEKHRLFFSTVATWVDGFGELRWREARYTSKLLAIGRRWRTPIKSNDPGEDAAAVWNDAGTSSELGSWSSDRTMVYWCLFVATCYVVMLMFVRQWSAPDIKPSFGIQGMPPASVEQHFRQNPGLERVLRDVFPDEFEDMPKKAPAPPTLEQALQDLFRDDAEDKRGLDADPATQDKL